MNEEEVFAIQAVARELKKNHIVQLKKSVGRAESFA